jgi:TetR/AcrR family transcriptional regulator
MKSTETKMFLQLPAQKQNRIVDAAIAEFAEKSYDHASMNVVVEKAGISKGALFKYFQSKSGLFAYVYRMALSRVKDYLRGVRDESSEAPFFQRLEMIMRAGIDFIQCHPRLARIYYRIILTGDSPYKKEILAELREESLKFIQSFVQQGIERGELRSDLNPRMAAFVLEAVLDRFMQAHHVEFLDHSLNLCQASTVESEQWIGEMVELFRKGMGSAGHC